MSDGMSDANAVGRIARELEHSAIDLRRAIKRAEEGHRGLTVSVIATVNEHLKGSGYRLQGGFDHRERF